MSKTIVTDDSVYEFRNEIIDLHLIMEDNIHTLVQSSFRVSVPISFSNIRSKLDLLLDIGIIDKKFASHFRLFSDVRNQFVHKLGCYRFIHLSEDLRKRLLNSQKVDKKYINDDEVLHKALKSLYDQLKENFLPKIFKAINHGHKDKQQLKNMKIDLENLIGYICKKYPNESKENLMSFFKFIDW